MGSKFYQHEDTDIYILELEGNFYNPQEISELEKISLEVSENPEIKKLIINQKGADLKILSSGFEKIVSMSSEMNKRGTIIKFSTVKGRLLQLIKTTKLDQKYPLYDSLEEAISSY